MREVSALALARTLSFCHRDPMRSPRSSSSGPRVCKPCANTAAVRALTTSEPTSW